MGSTERKLTPLDELYLQRSYELAARGIGNTAPNPPVGAVVVRDGHLVGEGYHYRAGDAHAERNALDQAGDNARGATLYVSLEPCRHVGRTPPCTQAVVDAGVVRVVAGALDPSGHGGAAELRERGVQVTVAGDPFARDLIESFARAVGSARPFVALKMAMSLDGAVASWPGVRERIGSVEEERYVRELRAASDAVMVGSGTVRVDDPRLTVRPPRHRVRPYVRVVAAARNSLDAASRVFASVAGYEKTIVLVPAAASARFNVLRAVAEVIAIDGPDDAELDLRAAMRELRERGIFSVLCEGGPRLAASMLAAGEVDRIYWAIAPRLLGTGSVPVLAGQTLAGVEIRFDRIERLGPDVMISGTVARV